MKKQEPSYEEIKRRLEAVESALRAIHEGRADTIMDGQGRGLLVRLAETENREAHLKQVLLAIRNVNQLIVSTEDAKQLIEESCRNLVETMGYFNAWIALFDRTEHTVTVTAEAGFDGGFAPMRERLLSGGYPDCLRKTMEQKALAAVQDPAAECPDCPLSAQYQGRAGLTHRLEFQGRVYGILSVSVPASFAHDAEEQSLFTELAGDLAFALRKIEILKEKHETEAALRQSHVMLTRTEAIAHVGSWEWEIESDRVSWSDELFRIFGREPAAGAPSFAEHSQLFLPEDMERLKEAVETCVSRGKPYEIELQAIRTDGQIRYCITRGIPQKDENGRIIRLAGSFQDVTGDRRQEERIALLGRMIDEAPASITIHDTEGRFLFANCRTFALHGYSEDEFMTINLHDLDVPESEALLAERFRQIAENGEATFEVEHYRKDGTVFPLQVLAKAIEWEGRSAVLSIASDITERKQAEQALKRSETFLRQVIDTSPSCIFVKDLDCRYVLVNEAIAKLYGIAKEEMIGRTDPELAGHESLSREEAERFLKDDREVILKGRPKIIADEMLTTHDNKQRCFYTIKTPLASEIMPGCMLGVATDITELKKVEAALRQSEEKFKEYVDNAPDGIFIADESGRYRDVNPAACALTGYTREELLNMAIPDLLLPEMMNPGMAHFAALRATGHADVDVMFRRKDGCNRWWTVNAVRLSDDRYIAFCKDITQQKQAKDQESRALHFLEFAVEQIPVPIIIARPPGVTITHFNQGALDLLAKPSDNLKTISLAAHREFWPTFYPDGTPYRVEDLPLTRAVRKGEVVKDVEIIVRGEDGDRWILVNAAPLVDNNGTIIAGIVVFPDITDRKQAEAEKEKLQSQLLQAQKMESIGRLAGGVAHDFNNMLGVILGHAELVLEKITANDPLREDVTEIFDAGRRSTEITRQLLAFARRQTIAPRTIDLNETVEGMLKMLRRLIGEDIDLAWEPGRNLWPVKIDPAQVDQVLANLLVNARDAIDGVGKITIETDNIVLDEGSCVGRPGFIPGDYVVLAVSDDGCGMDTETLNNIFEPFFTTKGVGDGTGLGLATVYGITGQNNGFINVYSEPGQGTTFKIYLPRHAGTPDETEVRETAELPAGNGETVLVVEDEPAVLNLTRKILTGLGYTVLTALNPEAALKAAEEQENIDLLMTDVIMPGMNGRELSERLQPMHPGLKVLFMSGYTADVIAHRGILNEGVHFVQKPFNRADLARKVREALGNHE